MSSKIPINNNNTAQDHRRDEHKRQYETLMVIARHTKHTARGEQARLKKKVAITVEAEAFCIESENVGKNARSNAYEWVVPLQSYSLCHGFRNTLSTELDEPPMNNADK